MIIHVPPLLFCYCFLLLLLFHLWYVFALGVSMLSLVYVYYNTPTLFSPDFTPYLWNYLIFVCYTLTLLATQASYIQYYKQTSISK